MKKSKSKISLLVCALGLALALTCLLAFTACGGGEKYTYSDVKVEYIGDDVGDVGSTMTSSLKTTYEIMFKDSYIVVSDSKIKWTISDQESVMTVTKEGDKYILAGDYVDQMKQALTTGIAGTNIDYEMYGVETESGFDIVMKSSSTVTAGAETVTSGSLLTVSFVK